MKSTHLGIALMIAAMLSFSVQDGLSRYLAETYNTPMVVAFRYWIFAVYVMILAARRPEASAPPFTPPACRCMSCARCCW